MAKQGLIPLRSETANIGRIYKKASDDIKDELLKAASGDKGELGLIKIEENVKDIVKRLNRRVIKWTNSAVPEAYKKSFLISRTRLEILGREPQSEFNVDLHQQEIEKGIDETIDVYTRANQSINQNVATYLYLIRQAQKQIQSIQYFDMRDEAVIAELLDEAIAEGESRQRLQTLIREHYGRQAYERKYININGRNYDLIYYGRMVSRTRLRTMQTKAVLRSCEQYGNDLVQISDHGTKTPICLPYEGNVYSLSGKSTKYPYMDQYTPFHPNCQHNTSATSEAVLESREQYA